MIIYFVDFMFGIGMFVNAALFIPQIIKIIKDKNAKDVSLMTFGGFNLIQVTILLHGYFHNDMFLAWGAAMSILTCGTVTGLIIYYQSKAYFKKRSRGRLG